MFLLPRFLVSLPGEKLGREEPEAHFPPLPEGHSEWLQSSTRILSTTEFHQRLKAFFAASQVSRVPPSVATEVEEFTAYLRTYNPSRRLNTLTIGSWPNQPKPDLFSALLRRQGLAGTLSGLLVTESRVLSQHLCLLHGFDFDAAVHYLKHNPIGAQLSSPGSGNFYSSMVTLKSSRKREKKLWLYRMDLVLKTRNALGTLKVCQVSAKQLQDMRRLVQRAPQMHEPAAGDAPGCTAPAMPLGDSWLNQGPNDLTEEETETMRTIDAIFAKMMEANVPEIVKDYTLFEEIGNLVAWFVDRERVEASGALNDAPMEWVKAWLR